MNPVLNDDQDIKVNIKEIGRFGTPLKLLFVIWKQRTLAWWTFRLHAYLPAFPAATVEIDEQEISPQEWSDESGIPESLQKDSLARHVWNYLDPAL